MSGLAALRTRFARLAGMSSTASAISSADCSLMMAISSRSLMAVTSSSFLSWLSSSKRGAVIDGFAYLNKVISSLMSISSAASAISASGMVSKISKRAFLSRVLIAASRSSGPNLDWVISSEVTSSIGVSISSLSGSTFSISSASLFSFFSSIMLIPPFCRAYCMSFIWKKGSAFCFSLLRKSYN